MSDKVIHPEVLWAQRSSETEEDKVRLRFICAVVGKHPARVFAGLIASDFPVHWCTW